MTIKPNKRLFFRSLPEKEFRTMIVKIIQNLENKMKLQINKLETRIERMQEMFKKNLEEIRKNRSIMNNAITDQKHSEGNQQENNWIRGEDK